MLAGLIGNVLEWFDFAVYGYFASDIGQQFFPQSSPTAQTLLAFAVFALGFVARPIGGLVLGAVGDRIGRRALMILSIALMGGATLAIGLLPNYDQIGVAAPILLVFLRLVQGFSLGGEFTGSMVYTTELAPAANRGIVSSSTAAGVTLGFILGSASAWLVSTLLEPAQVSAWGWRIPFIGSVIFFALGWFLRRGLEETPEGVALPQSARRCSRRSRRIGCRSYDVRHRRDDQRRLLPHVHVRRRTPQKALGVGSDAGADFLLANTLSLFVVLFAKPFGGWLSDRVGRRRLMILLTIAGILLIIPALWLQLHGDAAQFFLGQALLAIPLGMSLGLQGALLVELFPLRTRVTSMSFAYSITLALTGGTAPLVATWLVERFDSRSRRPSTSWRTV